MEHGQGDPIDFFVSYAPADQAWAVWIAWTLEAEGYHVKVEAWDSPAGSNRIQDMQAWIRGATRAIAVLSPDYVASVSDSAEWQAVWAKDPKGTAHKLLPVRVSDCALPELLAGIVSIDLFGIEEGNARCRLRGKIAGAIEGRQKPEVAPAFPGDEQSGQHRRFPGVPAPDRSAGLGRHDDADEEPEGDPVSNLLPFRPRDGRDSTGASNAMLLDGLIEELTESAELVSASYSAGRSEYLWMRIELRQRLARVKSQLDLVTDWVARAGMAEDLGTFDLTHSLRLYPGAAEEFAGALTSLEASQSTSGRRGWLADYEAAWQTLRDILWGIHHELAAAQGPLGPDGLR